MKKIWNGVCVGLGFLFFGLGATGAVMPVLPATPFLLAAAFFFARGSTRFHQWFVGTNLYRRYIEQAVKHKAMDQAAKRNMLVTLGIVFVIGFLFSPGICQNHHSCGGGRSFLLFPVPCQDGGAHAADAEGTGTKRAGCHAVQGNSKDRGMRVSAGRIRMDERRSRENGEKRSRRWRR